jgi:Protein of unknown function (DUF2911)
MRSVWVIASLLLALTVGLAAQRPRVSPHETHEFTIDESHVSFDYGRPSKRGRVIWGGLVPWGRWWMPGADEATILTTDHALVLGGTLRVPAGRHTLYMLPSPDAPKLIVNNQVGQFHTSYSPRFDLGRIDFNMTTLSDPVEQLTFRVTTLPAGGGKLELLWDDRDYWVTVTVEK